MKTRKIISCILALIMIMNTVPPIQAAASEPRETETITASGSAFQSAVEQSPALDTAYGNSGGEEEFNQINVLLSGENGINYVITATASAVQAGEVSARHTVSDSNYDFKGIVEIPEQISYGGLNYTVTAIADSAFMNRTNVIGTLKLPETIKTIGKQAFFQCKGLTGDLIIPDSVEEIGDDAFYGCSGFNGKLKLAANIKSIGSSSFAGCSNLTGQLTVSGKLKNIAFATFSGCQNINTIILESGIENIDTFAFAGLSNIKSLIIPQSVKVIGGDAFAEGGFEEVIILSDNIKFVPYSDIYNAFQGCKNLKKVTISSGLKEIPAGTFCDCLNLKEIYIPDSVTLIARNAFIRFYDGSNLNVTIFCNENSYAHKYAVENDFQYVLLDYTEPALELTYQSEEWLFEKDSQTLTASASQISKSFALRTNKVGCTFSSSDPKVAEVDGKGKVTIKGTGTTVLTARLASETAVRNLSVYDYTPKMPENTITVNQAVTEPAGFRIYPVYGSEVLTDGFFYSYEKASKTYTPVSGITYGKQAGNSYPIQLNPEIPNKTYSLFVKAEVQQEIYYLPVKIKVVSTKPKISVKAASINAFYTDEAGRTSKLIFQKPDGITVTGISIDSKMAKFFDTSFSGPEEAALILKPVTAGTELKEIVKKGSLEVQTAEYQEPFLVPVSVLVTKKAPSLVQSEPFSRVNTWLHNGKGAAADFEIFEKVQKKPLRLSSVSLIQGNPAKETEPEIEWKGNQISLRIGDPAPFQKAVSLRLAVMEENWLEPVVITHRIQTVKKKPEAKLSKKALSFDRSISGAFDETELTFTARPGTVGYEKLPAAVPAVKNRERAPLLFLEPVNEVHYRLRASADGKTQKGTYTYQISPLLTDGTVLKPVTLKLTVTEAKKEPAVKAKLLKGSRIDLAARETTELCYRLAASNKAVTVSGAALLGEAGEWFTLEEIRDGDGLSGLRIQAKPEAALLAGKSYLVPVTFHLKSGYDGSPLPGTDLVFNIKPKESALKIRMNQTKAVLYAGVENSGEEFLVSLAAPSGAKLSEIKDTSKNIPEGAFEIETDLMEGSIRISIKDSGRLLRNKSYTFQFGLRAEGGNKYQNQKICVKIK